MRHHYLVLFASLICLPLPSRTAAQRFLKHNLLLRPPFPVERPFSSDARNSIIPSLHTGQTLTYNISGHLVRLIKTESRVATFEGPKELNGSISGRIVLTIKEVRPGSPRPLLAVQAKLFSGTETSNSPAPPASYLLTFNLLENGDFDNLEGFDALSPELRLLWQFWQARFSYPWTIPTSGVKPGAKWRSEELERNPSLIAALSWEKQTTYVRNTPCPFSPQETCAILITQSKLKQNSSTEDSTPDEYKIRELKTNGTAIGTNEVISYVSLSSGLLQRASEDVKQSMDVTVMKRDGSNGVHYEINASSNFEIRLVP